MRKKKLLLSLFSILLLGSCFVAPTINHSSKVESTSADETIYGKENIWLWCYSNGTNLWWNSDERKFHYDSETEQYKLTWVFYEGDYFSPYHSSRGFIYWTNNYPEATEKFTANHVTRYSTTSYFQVTKTGTYTIYLDKNFANETNMSYTWQYTDKSYVEYVSDSIDLYEPTGYEDVYLYGTFEGDSRWSSQTAKKIQYDATTRSYQLTTTLYAGDIFDPYMASLKNRYISYCDDTDVVNQMNQNNIYQYTGTTHFIATKTGTYEISISYHIEYLQTASDAWKLAHGSYIRFVSEEITVDAPKGNMNIYLYGTFDGVSCWGTNTAKRFTYDSVNQAYVLKVSMYKGDVFEPYLASDKNKYICYVDDTYADNMFTNNHVAKYSDSNNFVCLKDGTYEISISYHVEFLTTLSNAWKEAHHSTITYLSSEIMHNAPKGSDKIYLVGTLSGKSITQASTNANNLFTFNPATNSYVLKINLSKNDIFRFYVDIRGLYLDYPSNDTYSENIFNGCELTNNNSNMWLVNKSGTYEISISYLVESLTSTNSSSIWKTHGCSYIRYLGEKSNTTYVLLGEHYSSKNTYKVFMDGESSIKQYGTSGTYILPTTRVSLNDEEQGILQLTYNPDYSSSFKIYVNDGDIETEYQGTLVDHEAYRLDDLTISSQDLYSECDYLYTLESSLGVYTTNDKEYNFTVDGISSDNASILKNKYAALNSTAKEVIDASSIKTDNEVNPLKIKDIQTKINNLIVTKQSDTTKTLLIALGVLAAFVIIFLFLIARKRQYDINGFTYDAAKEDLVNKQIQKRGFKDTNINESNHMKRSEN